MKIKRAPAALAAALALGAGALAAGPAAAAHLTFDVTYTYDRLCTFNGALSCYDDPAFQPFSTKVTYQVTIGQRLTTIYDPGQVEHFIIGAASIDPAQENAGVLAFAGVGAAPMDTSNIWGIDTYVDPDPANDFTTFGIGGAFRSDNGATLRVYGQNIGFYFNGGNIPIGYDGPSIYAGILDFIAAIGPFDAFETGSVIDYAGSYRSRDTRLTGFATLDRAASDIPEPAVWTMMIAGFGLAGAALRRRRGAAAWS